LCHIEKKFQNCASYEPEKHGHIHCNFSKLSSPGEDSTTIRSWGDADAECQARTGYLASIHSDIENKAFVSWAAQRNVWIGLRRNGWGEAVIHKSLID